MLKFKLLVVGALLLTCFSTTTEAASIKVNTNKYPRGMLLAQPTYYRIWHDNERIQRQQYENEKHIRSLASEFTRKGDYIGLGSLYYSNGYVRDAITAYTMAIEANPKDSDGYFLRARVKSHQGDLRGAITDYDATIALTPESDGAYTNRAIAKYKLKNKDGSLQDFRSAARIRKARGAMKEWADTISRIQYFFGVPE
jgi:tetratricopeptide (TPR) repeat protein